HAERRQPVVRRVRARAGQRGRADHHVLRHDGGRRRGGGRAGGRDRPVPPPRVAQSRRVHVAEVVMIALIPLFPLLGFAITASMGRRLSKTISGGLASLVMLASFAVSVAVVWQVASLAPTRRAVEQTLYTWISSGDFVLDLTLRVDPLASV